MKTKKSPPTSIRLSEDAVQLRKLLAQHLGVSEAAVLELLIREGAEKRGIMLKQHIIGIEFENFTERKNAIPQLKEMFENVSQHQNSKQGIHVICSRPIGKTYDEAFEICKKKYVECGWINPDSL